VSSGLLVHLGGMNALARAASVQPLRALVRTAAAVACCVVGGCSNDVDTSENKLPYRSEETIGVTDTSDVEVSAGACDCLTVGRWYRMDTLALITIDGKDHPVIPTLNALWKSDISVLELDIMLEVKAVSETSVTIRIVNGARVDGTQDICQLGDTAIETVFPRNGCSLEASAESAFNVYAGTQDFPKNCSTTLPVKHAIPVSRARLEGTLNNDCSGILNGKVPSGGLGQSELDKVCTCLLLPGAQAEECGALDASFADTTCVGCNANYQPLGGLLKAFGEPDWLCQTETGALAACLTADFTAVAMEAPPSCQ